jgi:hypothetical protein
VRATGRRSYAFYASAVAVALFCVRLLGQPWTTHFRPQFPDALNPGRTDTYYAVARLSPFRPKFYWSPRPVVYPAFVWLFGRSSHLIVLGQTAAYCAAFAVLCVTVHQLIRTRLIANVAVVLLALIAIQARFALWNTQILSESLGISLGIMAIAMWGRVALGPTARRVTWAWGWTIVWLLERDAHTVPIAAVVVPASVVLALTVRSLAPDARRRLLMGSVIALVACGYVYRAQQVTKRNQYPFDNNVGLRILPSPSLRAWFVAGGMPLDASLAERRGHSAFDDDRRFVNDPSLARYRRWAEGPGSRRLALSLVVRARDWDHLLGKELRNILADDYQAYDGYGVNHRLPGRLPWQLGGPGTPMGLMTWLLLATIILAAAAIFSSRLHPIVFAFGGLLVVLVDIYCSYVGDALEVNRHLAGPLSRLSVMLVIAIAVGYDALVQARLAHRSEVPVDA